MLETGPGGIMIASIVVLALAGTSAVSDSAEAPTLETSFVQLQAAVLAGDKDIKRGQAPERAPLTVFERHPNQDQAIERPATLDEVLGRILDYDRLAFYYGPNKIYYIDLVNRPEYVGHPKVITTLVRQIEEDPEDYYRARSLAALANVLRPEQFKKSHEALYRSWLHKGDVGFEAMMGLIRFGIVDEEVTRAAIDRITADPQSTQVFYMLAANKDLFCQSPKILDAALAVLLSDEKRLWEGFYPTSRDQLARAMNATHCLPTLDERQTAAFKSLLEDPSWQLRQTALTAMVKVGPADARIIETLKTMSVRDEFEGNRDLADAALVAIEIRHPESTDEVALDRRARLARKFVKDTFSSDPGDWFVTGSSRVRRVWTPGQPPLRSDEVYEADPASLRRR